MSSKAEREYMAKASPIYGESKQGGRTVPMKVICPAMSRSGTGAMRQALEKLGVGRTYHGLRLGERPGDLDLWIDMADRKYSVQEDARVSIEDFDQVLGDCGAVTDMPCAAFWRELLDAYSDAQVVLVERDLETWYRSFNQAVIQGLFSMKGQILANHWVAKYIGYRNPELLHRLFLRYFQARNKREIAENAKGIYVEHNEAVRRICRQQERPFLDYKLGSGWQPLCSFLEVDVPKDGEFPRGNEAEVLLPFIHKAQRELLIRGASKLLKQSSLAAVVLSIGWVLWRRPGSLRAWLCNIRLP